VLDDTVLDHLRQVAALPDLTGTRYRLIDRLGQGGMGSVWRVHDAELDREVALKVLDLPDEAGRLATRLRREARLLARLEHPSIVPVHDVGTLADGRVFYVMKRVRGRRLDEWAREPHPLPVRLRLFQRICEAAAFAHAAGIIHRDLKPQNVMVGEYGEALVMDWGLARALREPGGDPADEDPTGEAPPVTAPPRGAPAGSEPAGDRRAPALTAHGTILGTPGYMPPEQERGEVGRLDARADVHALGGILYYLLAARAPGGPPAEIPGIPRPLRAVWRRAMAPGPSDRYPDADRLAAEIERHLDGMPIEAYRENPLEKALRFLGRHRLLATLIVAYLVMRLAVLFFTGR
jgi:serine/threonine protein kinase